MPGDRQQDEPRTFSAGGDAAALAFAEDRVGRSQKRDVFGQTN